MAYWLVDSPGSGDGSRDSDFWLKHLREQGINEVTVCKLGDAENWIRHVSEGDCLMAAGGDGTVNGVASLCLRTGATLAVLPSGTANDFARNLGLPEDPSEVVRLVAEGGSQRIDVAEFADRIYLNVAHIGLGPCPPEKPVPQPSKLWGNSATWPPCFSRWVPSGASGPGFRRIAHRSKAAGSPLRLPREPTLAAARKYRKPRLTMDCWM